MWDTKYVRRDAERCINTIKAFCQNSYCKMTDQNGDMMSSSQAGKF